MSTPTSGSSTGVVTLRPDLASPFTEFDLDMNARGYIGHRVFPVIEVGLQSDNIGRVPLEQLLFEAKTDRASRSGYNRGDFEFERFQYSTEEHGWEEVLSTRDEKRYQHVIQAEMIATQRAMGVVTRNGEKRVAAKLHDTGIYTVASGMQTQAPISWSDRTATPIDDVKRARIAVWRKTGFFPNALVINYLTFLDLQQNLQVIERINSQGAGHASKPTDINVEMLSACFSVEVIVAEASQNTAGEGLQRQISQIWNEDFAVVCRVSHSIDPREACVGRTFHWSEDGSTIGGTVEEYHENQTRGRIIRVRHDVDEARMYKEAAHLITGVRSGPTAQFILGDVPGANPSGEPSVSEAQDSKEADAKPAKAGALPSKGKGK